MHGASAAPELTMPRAQANGRSDGDAPRPPLT